ncbi:MAG: ATP-binding protein, partial [Saprospiraceae bacterium]
EARDKKIRYLGEMTRSYLYKDVLEISNIKNSHVLRDLLRLLSLQIGSEVSYNELGRTLGLSTITVQRYIDLLEQAFVIKVVGGFSRNLRKEIAKKQKVYFLDLGVRNALIEKFAPLNLRDDKGALWENFMYIERLKLFENNLLYANRYFWRLHTGAELDLVEEADGKLAGYEFKFGNRKPKAPKSWMGTYPEATYQVINRDNYLPFILEPPERSY